MTIHPATFVTLNPIGKMEYLESLMLLERNRQNPPPDKIDIVKLSLFLKEAYPMIFTLRKTRDIVAYRFSIASVLYNLKSVIGLGYSDIGRMLRRDHATIIYAVKTTAKWYECVGYDYEIGIYEDVNASVNGWIKSFMYGTI